MTGTAMRFRMKTAVAAFAVLCAAAALALLATASVTGDRALLDQTTAARPQELPESWSKSAADALAPDQSPLAR